MATSVRTPDQAAASGVRRAAQTGYRWLLLVFLLAVAVQIFLAGLGVFSFGAGDRAGGSHAFSAHQGLGWALARRLHPRPGAGPGRPAGPAGAVAGRGPGRTDLPAAEPAGRAGR